MTGYCPARDEAEVARFAGYPVEELIIERLKWNGKEFTECRQRKWARKKTRDWY